ELEAGARLLGMPRIRKNAVGKINSAEAEWTSRRRRRRLCGERRDHRIEHGQRHHGAERAAQERAAREVLLGDDHRFSDSLVRLPKHKRRQGTNLHTLAASKAKVLIKP